MQTRRWQLHDFGESHLRLETAAMPEPGPGEVRIAVRALSLNYRDLLVIRGQYNPHFALPATPISDAAGVIDAVGEGVDRDRLGERVATLFVSGWQDGPFSASHLATTLGLPGPGVAAEHVVLPATAAVPIPNAIDDGAASTLPIAGLTAWTALSQLPTDTGDPTPLRGRTVLTLGTGGVSVFAIQLGTALGARVLVTSSSDAKLERARSLGAEQGFNYAREPRWDKAVLAATGGHGVDLVVENGGAGTLSTSLRCARAGGHIALLGALTGLRAEIDIAPLVMKQLCVRGVMVNHRAAFERLIAVVAERAIAPVIETRYSFDALPAALEHISSGRHLGKIVIDVG